MVPKNSSSVQPPCYFEPPKRIHNIQSARSLRQREDNIHMGWLSSNGLPSVSPWGKMPNLASMLILNSIKCCMGRSRVAVRKGPCPHVTPTGWGPLADLLCGRTNSIFKGQLPPIPRGSFSTPQLPVAFSHSNICTTIFASKSTTRYSQIHLST
jgi:hypothetical protein